LGLYLTETYDDWQDALINGLFQAVSIGTTAGFTTAEFYNWPGFIAILLLFSSFVGGCAGSTGGGIKVIRLLLLVKQGLREITRLVHPNAKIPVRIGDKTVDSRVVEAVWGFFALYVASFTVMYLALASTGLDLMTAFSAVAASINNLGSRAGRGRRALCRHARSRQMDTVFCDAARSFRDLYPAGTADPRFLAQVNAFPMATELERGYFDPKRSRLCDLSMLPGLGSR
jgi:hypothetical protein